MKSTTASFYFANLGADVVRCTLAGEAHDEMRYASSLARAYKTLAHLRKEQRYEAYEEGLLLLRGLEYARQSETLSTFRTLVNTYMQPFALRMKCV